MESIPIFIIGNSHVWTIVGWKESAPIDYRAQGSVIRKDTCGLNITAAVLTEVTAYSLINREHKIKAFDRFTTFLDNEQGDEKTVLVVYGEIDCSTLTFRKNTSVIGTVSRYAEFLSSIASRSDVKRLIVASTIPHAASSAGLREVSLEWNECIMQECIKNGWDYLDIYNMFIDESGFCEEVMDKNHLKPEAKEKIIPAILTML